MSAPLLFEADDLVIEARKAGAWRPIIDHVSFCVRPGEVVALIGETGSGKTTLGLSAMAYFRPGCRHTHGRALLRGVDVLQLDPEAKRQLRGNRVAYLAQSAAAAFNPSRTIGEQVTESARIHGSMSMDDANLNAIELYHALELPDPYNIGRRYPHEVSGGQLQRLMAAMALCNRPELLVLDEPTTALDVTTQIEVLQAFKRVIRDQDAAAVYITHDLALVAQIADRVVVLRDGRERESGPIHRIIEAPRDSYTRKLMAAVRPMHTEQRTAAEDNAVLQLRDLSAGYGRRRGGEAELPVLADIDLTIHRGETLGIIGESGCGKSTLAQVISGALPPTRGELRLDGEALPAKRTERTREQLRRVQFVFQMADTALNPRQRVREILGRPLELYRGLNGQPRRDRVRELLEIVELPADFADRFPPELSGGQKQRVNLARALAAEPDLVLCDEVTSALDVVVGAAVIRLLKKLRADLGVSYMFISHDLSTVSGFCDTIAVLYAGRVVESGDAEMVLSPPFHPYSRLLVSSVPELRVGWLSETVARQETRAGVGKTVSLTEPGCPFNSRCPYSIVGTCDTRRPPTRKPVPGHKIACHLPVSDLPK